MLMWRQRSLSYREKPLIINALALSRIWYVVSLVHMPPFVLCEPTNSFLSSFGSGGGAAYLLWWLLGG